MPAEQVAEGEEKPVAKVLKLAPPPALEPDAGVVDLLTRLLDAAKDGSLRSIACVALYVDEVERSFDGLHTDSSAYETLGALQTLSADIRADHFPDDYD